MCKSIPGAWSVEKVLEVLGTRVAMAAMRGKPSPVAAKALRHLEFVAFVNTAITEELAK